MWPEIATIAPTQGRIAVASSSSSSSLPGMNSAEDSSNRIVRSASTPSSSLSQRSDSISMSPEASIVPSVQWTPPTPGIAAIACAMRARSSSVRSRAGVSIG